MSTNMADAMRTFNEACAHLGHVFAAMNKQVRMTTEQFNIALRIYESTRWAKAMPAGEYLYIIRVEFIPRFFFVGGFWATKRDTILYGTDITNIYIGVPVLALHIEMRRREDIES